MSDFRLLAIHAHPDDESSKGAATTARYAAEGADVMVLTCTGGERGDIINPAMDRPGVKENMAEVRREEMATAARALGVEHQWLGHVDSGLPDLEEGKSMEDLLPEGCFALMGDDAAAQEMVRVIRSFRPHVIITYDENGGYPHPDHLMVHRASMIAWEKAGDVSYHPELGEPWEPLKLYYTHGFVYQRMKMFHDLLVEEEKPSPYGPMLARWDTAFGDIMARVTTQVECAAYFQNRDDALRAHATQIDPAGAFLATSVEVQQRLWPTEEFELAKTRVSTSLPENDLFAGIEKNEET
ncbi:mycothiol conjugate amidase Mca [Corynebacterium macginleyi]|uniref:mycothiol conjugate amidase Mca n=1 Tax=Corynebacterium macginleyi TaxID=38290 RepID=UPI000EF9F76F|nr:mycothiol conjugate amidase Mca [Corynebacterium macginleyi]QRP20671.1 mycothiol conjugate amidase Mca [Corynebacterium macginleyi]RMB67654.1 mycothiol conjugate amidase Mca [Corynebacterium macginleyi]RMB70544.1 mycothiol conjugate amidase Mca [Corynebacterium macginleyi]